MAVYIFNLLVGYMRGGIDHAQGTRALMLKDFPHPLKFIYTEVPTKRELDLYNHLGISTQQMLSMHQYFTDNHTLGISANVDDKLVELRGALHYTGIEYLDTEIRLVKGGYVIAALLLDEKNKKHFYTVHYFNDAKLIRAEFYTNGIFYADSYVTARSDAGLYAKMTRRTFYNSDGSTAYEQVWKEGEERYLFPDGKLYTKPQLVAEFLKKLNLSEEDIIFIDRDAVFELSQPLFQFSGKARIMTFFHSDHCLYQRESRYWNREYLYLLKYVSWINTIVVSTQEQKEVLTEKLKEYKCRVPHIKVIPVAALDQLRYPEKERKRYSLITVSRVNPHKRIDWIIKSVIKAHQKNPNVFIDIYGDKNDDYFQYLQNIISEDHAQSYVNFKGYMDVTEVYQNYEVYLSASLGETFGLTLMEAAGSGTAMIGLDVKYGNRLFIQPEKNGYLVDFDSRYLEGDDSTLIDQMAEKIVEIFEDEKRLKRFSAASYEIAKSLSTEIVARQWKDLLS